LLHIVRGPGDQRRRTELGHLLGGEVHHPGEQPFTHIAAHRHRGAGAEVDRHHVRHRLQAADREHQATDAPDQANIPGDHTFVDDGRVQGRQIQRREGLHQLQHADEQDHPAIRPEKTPDQKQHRTKLHCVRYLRPCHYSCWSQGFAAGGTSGSSAGRCPAAALGSSGAPEVSPAWLASAVASFAWPRASRTAPGRCPAPALGSSGAPDGSPPWLASAVASFAWPRASRNASAGSCSEGSGSWTSSASMCSGVRTDGRSVSSSPSSELPSSPPVGAPPDGPGPNAEVIEPSAAVNSVGMTHSLEEEPLAISGSICRYW